MILYHSGGFFFLFLIYLLVFPVGAYSEVLEKQGPSLVFPIKKKPRVADGSSETFRSLRKATINANTIVPAGILKDRQQSGSTLNNENLRRDILLVLPKKKPLQSLKSEISAKVAVKKDLAISSKKEKLFRKRRVIRRGLFARGGTSPKLNEKLIVSSYTVRKVTYYPVKYNKYKEIGIASWYGRDDHKKLTASGEIFDKHKITAAHKLLPLPSIVRVTNLENNKSLLVKVNDRGPFVEDRLIDLSEKAAKLLGFQDKGLVLVKVELVSYGWDAL